MQMQLKQYKATIENGLIIFLGTACIFFITIKGWIESFNLLDITTFVYLIYLSIGLLCIINYKNFINYSSYLIRTNVKSIDFLIVISLMIFLILQGSVNIYALSFICLFVFISSIVSSQEFNKDYRYVLFSVLFVSIITVIGIFIGVLENFLFESKFFHANKFTNYPSPISIKYHFSGFQFSYNYSAYIIMSGLGITHLVLPYNSATTFLRFVFFVGLFLTQAKAAFLYIAIIVVMSIQNRVFIFFRTHLLVALLISYCILCHFTFAASGAEINSEHYFRDIKLSISDINVYSTLFLWLKEIFIVYISSNNLSEVSVSGFQSLSEGLEPHSMLLSSYLFGGIIFSILIFFKILKVVYEFYLTTSPTDKYFLSLVMVFFIESIVWDAYDSPIFWIVILFCPLYGQYKDKSNHYYSKKYK